MMSHYGLPFDYDDHWICGALELSIETLAGTAFEIKVSPNDTIMAIKSKIQSVEGIPVSQQHLLYNLEELDNSASLRDYSIQNGATLKLVLSMRGGPISTKRLPPVDEVAWRELQEIMSVTRKDDLFEKLPTGSRITVLVFRDGDQVNLLRVVENEDGSFSPLSESWNGSSVRNLFAEEDPEESAKRLQENSVTMGKMQELKEKLEALSIQKKEKKENDSNLAIGIKSNVGAHSSNKNLSLTETPRKKTVVSFPSGDCGRSNCVKLIRGADQEVDELASHRPRNRLLSCNKSSIAGLSKARKEAENIIRIQSNLSILVDSEINQEYRVRRTPLPDIHRSPSVGVEEKKSDEEELGKNFRGKTSKRFAIVEENDLSSAAAAGICSSKSSVVALPSSEEVAVTCSRITREDSPTVTNTRFRVAKYFMDSNERPKTTPGKLDVKTSFSTGGRSCNSVPNSEIRKQPTCGNLEAPDEVSKVSTKFRPSAEYNGAEEKKSKKRASTLSRNPSFRELEQLSAVPLSLSSRGSSQKLPLPSTTKKRLRCFRCKKKLNITNAYTCRCKRTFCSVHRYSEVHNCLFDYKEEGRRILLQANPLVAASKLPKI